MLILYKSKATLISTSRSVWPCCSCLFVMSGGSVLAVESSLFCLGRDHICLIVLGVQQIILNLVASQRIVCMEIWFMSLFWNLLLYFVYVIFYNFSLSGVLVLCSSAFFVHFCCCDDFNIQFVAALIGLLLIFLFINFFPLLLIFRFVPISNLFYTFKIERRKK